MQSLEDVLLLAMKGADPFVIDSMLRARGDYRPHQEFGINLNVPWSAGTQEKPSWEVVGAKYSKTRMIDGPEARVTGEIAWVGEDGAPAVSRTAVAGASAARPWERVGGSGWDDAEPEADRYTPVPGRPDLQPGSAEAGTVAEEFNDRGMAHFEKKEFREAMDCYTEAGRLQPGKAPFHGNRAAAALKLGKHREAREAAEAAVAIDKTCAADTPHCHAPLPNSTHVEARARARLFGVRVRVRRAVSLTARRVALLLAAGMLGTGRGLGRRSQLSGAPRGRRAWASAPCAHDSVPVGNFLRAPQSSAHAE